MDTKSNIKESFINEAIGNFLDCITNNVYSLQKYVDEFYENVMEIYAEPKLISGSQEIKNIIKFIIPESENIIRFKCVNFVYSANTTMMRKYESFREFLTKKEASNFNYKISEEAYLFLDTFQNKIDWVTLQVNQYSLDADHNYDFTIYMFDMFQKYESMSFKMTERLLTNEELIAILDGAFLKLTATCLQYKIIIDSTNTMSLASNICKQIIEIYVLIYFIMSTIQVFPTD